MAKSTLTLTNSALQDATNKSTIIWRQELEALFQHAKDRFPDVVWELGGVESEGDEQEVWGHKAMVYARAPPSFQARYFSFRQNPYSSSPPPTASALSLDLSRSLSRTPSPFRSSSPTTSAAHTSTNALLRLSTSMNPALFSNELEYLYTGQGFGEAFEFLFDSAESSQDEVDAEELRIDKLRKDLVFMWRSRLYSDVRIALTGNFSSNHENTTAIFSSHRFILVSRSPYFHSALLAWPHKNEPQTLNLPSPPFTPASLHFTLGFIYTGTLIFSHRSYDLDTAFHIMRSSTYLSLSTLYDEIQARIVQEMMHGLFHAFLSFNEYETLTSRAWGTGGCRCRQCARRAPRVLEFSLAEDVKNAILERGARRALVGLFGEGWCTSEFVSLPHKIRDSLLKGVGKRTTVSNVFALLFAAEHALGKLSAVIDAWVGEVKEMILIARKGIDDVICGQSDACFSGQEWIEIMERDGVAFEDAERVEWIMASVLRGVNERNAATLYQTLVSSILLRPHPTETNAPMLSSTSHVRVQVEEARMDLLKWIGKRWLGIRQESGFNDLEGWALKEISDNIEVPLEDMLSATLPASQSHLKPLNPPRQSTLLRAKETESNNDTISMHSSMRVSVRSRNLPTNSGPRRGTPSPSSLVSPTRSTATSYKSLTRTNASTTSLSRNSPLATNDNEKDDGFDNSRPDSKLTPGLGSIGLPAYSSRSASPTPQPSIAETDNDSYSRNDDLQETNSGIGSTSSTPAIPRSLSLDHNQHSNAITTPSKKIVVKKVVPSTRQVNATKPHKTAAASVPRPVSSASSVRSLATSVHSVASTIRRGKAADKPGLGGLQLPKESNSKNPTSPILPPGRSGPASGTSRASSTHSLLSSSTTSPSNATDSTSTFRTANSTIVRSRRTSTASANSTISTQSTRGDRASPIRGGKSTANTTIRSRKTSTGSTKSGFASTTPVKRPPLPSVDTNKLSPATAKRPVSSASSIRSTTSTVSTAASVSARKASTIRTKKGDNEAAAEKEKVPNMKDQENSVPTTDPPTETPLAPQSTSPSMPPDTSSSTITIKGKSTAVDGLPEHKKTSSTTSTGSVSTLKRKGSSDTITTRMSIVTSFPGDTIPITRPIPPSPGPDAITLKPLPSLPISARGATLEIGIPCIISSKRKRFKAYARYIGEVEGEDGPWVGVEVPVNDSWNGVGGDRDDAERQWNDGTWGGIRYFDIGNFGGSEWEYGTGGNGLGGEERAFRRRRLDWAGTGSMGNSIFGAGKSALKREGEQLSVERVKRFRSVSPAISDASGMESRGLFVRPQQVLYVMDAVGPDL